MCTLDVQAVYEELMKRKKKISEYNSMNFFSTCKNQDDFAELKYDIDSLHIIGDGTLSWLRPKIQFSCNLKSVHAWPCNDKKLTDQLDDRFLKLNPGWKLKFPLKSKTNWITFTLGGSNIDKIRVYSLTEMHGLNEQKCFLKTYRKDFFEKYVFRAISDSSCKCSIKVLDSSDNEKVKVNSVFNLTHTRLVNCPPKIPSSYGLTIFPDSWSSFTKYLEKLLKEKLPNKTLGIYFGITIHGAKNDYEIMSDVIIDKLKKAIYEESMSDICLMQFHIAATMKIDNNIIVSDHTKLKNICKSGINLYKKFCLKEKLGYFTTKSLKDEYNYKNATYTQFYLENMHLLLKGCYALRASFFLNAALGLDGIANYECQDIMFDLPDLGKHIPNMINWCDKLERFFDSLAAGTVGRFETVYSYSDLDYADDLYKNENTNEQLNQDNIMPRKCLDEPTAILEKTKISFEKLFLHFLKNDIFKKSTGTWWQEYLAHVNATILQPLMRHPNCEVSVVNKPMTIMQLRNIYDMEQILMIFIEEGGKKCLYDSTRLKYIETNYVDNQRENKNTFGKYAEHLVMNYNIGKLDESITHNKKLHWFSSKTITRRGYLPSVTKRCELMIQCAPYDIKEQLSLVVDPLDSLFRAYEFCVSDIWDLDKWKKIEKVNSCFLQCVIERERTKRPKIFHRSKLRIDEMTVTSMAVKRAILQPNNVLGSAILHRTLDFKTRNCLISDKDHEVERRISEKFQIFPMYLIDSSKANNWYRWALVRDDAIIYRSIASNVAGLITNTTNRGQHRYNPYARDLAGHYTKLNDTKKNLKHYKG